MTGMRDPAQALENFPSNTVAFAEFAEALAERMLRSNDAGSCFAAIVAAAHLPDWYFNELGLKFGDKQKKLLSEEFPQWETLRQLSNGAKHSRKQNDQMHPIDLKMRVVRWEDMDAWDHLGSTRPYWFFVENGRERSVHTLCRNFIKEFRKSRDL